MQRYTVQQLLQWRPCCRHWPLQTEVRDLVRRLGLGRRGCRGGRSRARPNVNIHKRSAEAIPIVLTERFERHDSVGRVPRSYGGVFNARASTLHRIKPTTSSGVAVTISSLNVRSLGNKHAVLSDYITSNDLHFFAAVETWHESSSCPQVIAATPSGYCCINKARPWKSTDCKSKS